MDRVSDSNFDQQTIYEIYRACRLCGAGAGYKMPIIQNVVDLDGRDVELKQKIRDCVQLEVSQDDKMPPLICELCVDKVNDFYEFLDMCRQTNKKTRHRLGLPPQTLQRGAVDTGDCILGLTEPVYVKDDPEEVTPRNKSKAKGKAKRDSELKAKAESEILEDRRSRCSSPTLKRRTRNSVPSPPPTRDRRHSDTPTKKAPAPLKSILKKEKEVKIENDLPRSKRSREKETPQEVPTKRVKIAAKPVSKPPKSSTKPNKANPKATNASRATSPKQANHTCNVCGVEFKSPQSLAGHQRVHTKRSIVTPKSNATKSQKNNQCPAKETQILPNTPRDLKCHKCERVYITSKNFQRHRRLCTFEKAPQVVIEPVIQRSLRRVEIRVARCDSLLTSRDSCRVTDLQMNYGLDSSCDYPYLSSVRSLCIKTEPAVSCDGMVAIEEEIKRELEEGAFVHWDSENSSDDDEEEPRSERRPEALSRLALKTIYSERFLGKAPRKKRRIKLENSALDHILRFEDDDLESTSDNVEEKVANLDEILKEERIEEKSGEVVNEKEDCAMRDYKDAVVSPSVGDFRRSDVSTNDSDSLLLDANSECKENETVVDDWEISKSQESNILNDIVNHQDEVYSKSNLNVSIEDLQKTNDKEKEDVPKENINEEEELSQELALNEDKVEITKGLNGKIKTAENDFAQTTPKLDEVIPEEREDETGSTDDTNEREDATQNEENGESNKDGDDLMEELIRRLSNAEEIEKDLQGREEENDDENDEEMEKELLRDQESDEEIEKESQRRDEQNDEEIEKQLQRSDEENEEKIEKELRKDEENQNDVMPNKEFDVGDDNTEFCSELGVLNGATNLQDEEATEEIKPEIVDNTQIRSNTMELGTDNETVERSGENTNYTAKNRPNINGGGDFNDEMDRKLMEELDAQIGECGGEGDSACDRDKITLADLLPDKAHERLDLDSIAEEFTFDP